MRLVIQRVKEASVAVGGQTISSIGEGLCVLVGIRTGDDEDIVHALADKMISLRIFSDKAGKMNRSVKDIGGEILAVSQFTLFADCKKGRRPSFLGAAHPDIARRLYEIFCERTEAAGIRTGRGIFGADMLVSISNDGPVTIILDSAELL